MIFIDNIIFLAKTDKTIFLAGLRLMQIVNSECGQNFVTDETDLELKQISEFLGYSFEIHYPDADVEPFRIVDNYFKQL